MRKKKQAFFSFFLLFLSIFLSTMVMIGLMIPNIVYTMKKAKAGGNNYE